ncbi:disease resistance protein RPV1-like isoform X3 [Cryptomeria japonica]|nr:disease resistance protein RPV1-like isoform X3 [Cryptomeria japonica]
MTNKIHSKRFNDISQLHELIQFIEELLKIASGKKSREGCSSAVSSYIQDGQTLLQLVEENIDRFHKTNILLQKHSMAGTSAEIERIVIELLEGAGKIRWVGAALSMVGFVLERCIQTSHNKSECLEILRRMVNLGKQILQLNDQMPDEKQKLNEAVQCIVVGCTMCASQLTTARVFRFLTASVNADSIQSFQVKIDRLYDDLVLWGITDMEKRLTKVAPQSQGLYAYQTAGCDSCNCFSPSSPSHPVHAGPSMANKIHSKRLILRFNDISQLDELIQFIEELLKIASGKKSREGFNSAVSSYIQDGQTLLQIVEENIDRFHKTKDSMAGTSAEIEKIVIELLEGAGKIHWVGAALSMVGFVLERCIQTSHNKSECLEILRRMVNLGKQILQLNDQLPDEKQKLNEAVQCIVVGCTMCASQLSTTRVFRFLTASVSAHSIQSFQVKIDRLYDDLVLWGITDMEKRLTKVAPQSQGLYAYQTAVGIESGRETVIRLLDLEAQHSSVQVVVVYGLGGMGKTTLADAVYANIDLQNYKHCRIHMEQNCTKNDLKVLQEQILNALFHQNVKLTDCHQGQGMIWSFLKKNPNQPVFLYIDNALNKADLKQLLPTELGSCLPPKSRILVTTRNLQETDIFVYRNIQRREYAVSFLPPREARKILLRKASEHNDENNIDALLKLCGGVPLLLEIIGSQLGISCRNTNNNNKIVLELIREGEMVEEEDISDRIVDYVYHRLLPPVKEAFLDITSLLCYWPREEVAYIVGEEEFRALEDATFVKTSEDGRVIVHDIVRARGKKMSEQNRVTDPETLLKCLKDEEKLKTLRGIFLNKKYDHPSIVLNDEHLKWMSNSLRVLSYEGSQITFRGKCHKPLRQLRYLQIASDIPDLPMEFEKLEHLSIYRGPFLPGMSFNEFPPSLRVMTSLNLTKMHASSQNRVAYSQIPTKVTPDSSLVKLSLYGLKNMERPPDGMENLTKLEQLYLRGCHQLRELPSGLGQLNNLKELRLSQCQELKELPSNIGQLSNLKSLYLYDCSALSLLPSSFGDLISLKTLQLSYCSSLKMLPSNFGQLKKLEELDLRHCYGLEEWPSNLRDLTEMKKMVLVGCSLKLKESLPLHIKESCFIVFD